MISQDHYNKCKNLFGALIEQNVHRYKEVVEPKEYWVGDKTFRLMAYREGFDPDVYRKDLEQEIFSSAPFNDLHKELISSKPRNDFYRYGKRFCIDVKEELKHFLDVSLKMYKAENVLELIQEEFKNLYFSIYADKFTIEVNTIVNIIINNFDSEETELLNQEEVKIKIRKQPKSTSHAAYACVVYEITDSKKKH
jgi:hypothetical protein